MLVTDAVATALTELGAAAARRDHTLRDIPELWPSRGQAQALFSRVPRFLLECGRAEGALRVQCRCVRGLGRVRRRVQLPLLELPCGDRLGILALGRDRAREAEGDQGCGLVDIDWRCPRRPREALQEVLLAAV